MKSKTYYIFRHAQTFVTASKISIWGYGFKFHSANILPEGVPTTKELAKYLRNISSDYNVCSEYLRCKQTASIVSKVTGKDFLIDKRLNDYSFETFWQFRKRVKNFLEDMEQDDKKTIVICTHGFVIAGLVQLLTTNKFTFREMFNFPPPGVLISIKNGKKDTIDFNSKFQKSGA